MDFPEIRSLKPSDMKDILASLDAEEARLKGIRASSDSNIGEIADAGEALDKVRDYRFNLNNAIVAAGIGEEAEETEEEVTETTDEVTSEETPEATEEIEETVVEETQEETTAEAEEAPEATEEESTEVTETQEEVTVEDEGQETTDETQEVTNSNTETTEEDSVENNGETIVADDINTPTEAMENVGTIAAEFRSVVDGATDPVEAVQKVKVRTNGGEAFKRIIETDNKLVAANLNAAQATDYIMKLGTPGRDGELSFAQKQYAKSETGSVTAAFCQPPQTINSDIQCGSYRRDIASIFPSFIMEGLEVDYFQPVDADDPDFVGQVDLTDSSINKACYTAGCLEKTTLTADEIKACLQANEQTAFTNPQGIRALLADGEALLAALGDELILEKILAETYKFGYTAHSAGYGEIKVAVAEVQEALNRQSKIHNVEDLEAIVPRSMLSYAVGDNAVRQFSTAQADEAARDIFSGLGLRGVHTYDDALDITNGEAVPALSRDTPTVLVPRTDWSIHLVNPADAVLGFRDENEYSLQPVPQSIAEKRANRLSWFARAYELFGRRGCSPWATIEIENLCLGGRVVAAATCIAS